MKLKLESDKQIYKFISYLSKLTSKNISVRELSLHHLARKKAISHKKKKKKKNLLIEDEKSLKAFFFNDLSLVSYDIPYCILAVVTWSREKNIF